MIRLTNTWLAHRSLSLTCAMAGAVLCTNLLGAQTPAPPTGAATFTIDNKRSLVWWQIDPHFGHLWASTCPRDPSWQPGEGHGPGYYINYAARPKIKTTNVNERRMPLFPRKTVRPNCNNALKGTLTTSEPSRFTDLKGEVILDPDSIATGAPNRDIFSRKYVFSSNKYPTVRFTIDSLSAITMSGDTIQAIAVGTFELRGVRKAMRVAINSVKEPSGWRVRGHFVMPAQELRDGYGVSGFAMGAGVGLNLWDNLYMGFDLIFTRDPASPGGGG